MTDPIIRLNAALEGRYRASSRSRPQGGSFTSNRSGGSQVYVIDDGFFTVTAREALFDLNKAGIRGRYWRLAVPTGGQL